MPIPPSLPPSPVQFQSDDPAAYLEDLEAKINDPSTPAWQLPQLTAEYQALVTSLAPTTPSGSGDR